ncbi:MAG: hypothetical protein KKA42_01970, partial [candidate division Zixibacteria bacterium]|nr:hypothetical protein [candidate division Zixibacteria bacterium]
MLSGTRKFAYLAVFTLLLILLVNLAWWFHYGTTGELLEEELSRRLVSIARTAGASFSPEAVDLLLEDDAIAYLAAVNDLETVRANDSLSEVFIIDENYHYLATTALLPDTSYFLSSLNGVYIDSLFFGEATAALTSRSYQSGRIYLKSAFAPLVDSRGIIAAVLGVEASVDYYDAMLELRQNLYLATGLSLLGGLVLGLVFLALQRRINAAEQRLYLAETHAHLGRMVAVVAHEVRNPLMIIRASAERLARKTGREEAAYVVEEVDRLNEIVTGYLDFARSGGSLLAGDSPEDIDLGALCRAAMKHLEERESDQKIEWLEPASPL